MMFWHRYAEVYATQAAPPIEVDADFGLGESIIDGDLLGGDSVENLGRLVARFGRGFRPYPRARG